MKTRPSAEQQRALALASTDETGTLVRMSGGYWIRQASEAGWPGVEGIEHIGTQTITACRDRGWLIITGGPSARPSRVKITLKGAQEAIRP